MQRLGGRPPAARQRRGPQFPEEQGHGRACRGMFCGRPEPINIAQGTSCLFFFYVRGFLNGNILSLIGNRRVKPFLE